MLELDKVHNLDCLAGLKMLSDESVQTCVTSPPYWGLRDYGNGRWEGGDAVCDHEVRIDPHGPKNTGKAQSGHAAKSERLDRGICPRCGARRVDAGIGLEPTLDQHIEHMVEVFHEVRRVLRNDGTLWLNLGDAYAGGGRGNYGNGISTHGGTVKKHTNGNNYDYGDIKPKNLVGLPWRVAFALQQPYYTGKIKSEKDRLWLAAMIDTEGCMFIHKRKAGQHNGQGYYRQNDNYGPGLEVANTSKAIVDRCQEITGLGSICSQSPEQNDRRKQTIYRWNLRTVECRDVIREIYPYLVAKKHQARILLGCPPSGEKAEAAHAALIGLHNGTSTDVDFPEPESLYEPGWYLRSDVIWSKANPMPESVTDRPTKAHEYVFLLAKSQRYYYDQDAVREPYEQTSIDRLKYPFTGGNKGGAEGSGRNWAVGEFDGGKAKVVFQHNGRNKRSVWNIPTIAYEGAHFATFPEALVEPCILAGCPVDGVVLDPFMGSGTTGSVALRLNRHFVGFELNPEYVRLANERIYRGCRRLDSFAKEKVKA